MSPDDVESRMGPTFNRLALRDRIVPRILADGAERYGDRHFASLPGGDLTFSGAVDLAARTSGMFSGLEVRPGDRVGSLVGNRIEFIASVWGLGWQASCAVPINTALIGRRLEYVINHADFRVLVVEIGKMPDVAAISTSLPGIEAVVVVGEGEFPTWAGPGFHRWDDLFAVAPQLAAGSPAFSDPLMMMYTSGTTGASKGVIISHHQYWCYASPYADNHEWGPDDHLYTPLPLCHASAHMALLVPGFIGGAQVTIRERFSPSAFWEDVAACGATHASFVGAAASILMRQAPSMADRGHRLKTIACSPPPADIKLFEKRFGVRLLWQAYGMTEGYFNHRVLEQRGTSRTAIGRPSPIFQVEILDDNDNALPHDGESIGEIAVRPHLPYSMIREYFRNPEATVEAFRNLWFHTGDLGMIEPDGMMHLKGRKTDSIRRRGENVSAVEVEQEVMAHPEIELAAAFAVPSDLGEDDIKVDITLVEQSSLEPEALIAWLEERLPAFMIPRYLQVRTEFPLTPSQRIEKYRLQQEGVGGAHYDGGDRRRRQSASG